VNVDLVEAVRPVLEAWVDHTCPSCTTIGFSMPGHSSLEYIPCDEWKPRWCDYTRCSLFGYLGCHTRDSCGLLISVRSCERNGYCIWENERCIVKTKP
jgi:hypothetical protein